MPFGIDWFVNIPIKYEVKYKKINNLEKFGFKKFFFGYYRKKVIVLRDGRMFRSKYGRFLYWDKKSQHFLKWEIRDLIKANMIEIVKTGWRDL